MAENFNYSGKINKKYVFNAFKDDKSVLSSIDFSKDINKQVQVYSFGNVDAFGAMALCWHDAWTDLSTAIETEIKAQLEPQISCWSQISASVQADANQFAKAGWMSINTRHLTKQ